LSTGRGISLSDLQAEFTYGEAGLPYGASVTDVAPDGDEDVVIERDRVLPASAGEAPPGSHSLTDRRSGAGPTDAIPVFAAFVDHDLGSMRRSNAYTIL